MICGPKIAINRRLRLELDSRVGYNMIRERYLRRNTMIRKFALAALIAMCVTVLAGCNTVKGVGKDIESGGKAIERSSGK